MDDFKEFIIKTVICAISATFILGIICWKNELYNEEKQRTENARKYFLEQSSQKSIKDILHLDKYSNKEDNNAECPSNEIIEEAPCDNPEESCMHNKERNVKCPMCEGTGIFDVDPGNIMSPKFKCSGCNGNGIVDINTAQLLIQGKKDIEKMINDDTNTQQPVNVDNRCRSCWGDGKCHACAGRGEVRYDGMYGQPDGKMDCPICHGKGICQTCYGRGY